MISFILPQDFVSYFKSMLEFQKSVRDEAIFKFTKDGIRVNSFDLGRVIYYSYFLDKSRLRDYKIDGEEERRECYSTKEIHKMLTRLPDDDILVEVDKDFKISSGNRKFSVMPYAIEEDFNKFPEDYTRTFRSTFTITASDFFDYVKDVQVATDILELSANGENKRVHFKSPDIAGLKTSDSYITYEASGFSGENELAYYSILAILEGETLSKLAQVFHVNFEQDAPFIISFDNLIKMKFVVVPRSL